MTTPLDDNYYKGIAEMLDTLPERVVRYRLPDLTINYCNAAWAGAYHLEPSEVVGQTLTRFLSQDGLAGLAAQLSRLGPNDPLLTDDVPREDLNAPGHWMEWVDQYLASGEVIAVGRDVTARYASDLKLAESEARFRDLADKTSDVVWRFVRDPSPHFDYMSPSVERSLGYPPSLFLDDFGKFLSILDDEGRLAIDRAMHGDRIPERYDFRFRHANGSIVVGETITTVLRDGLQGVSRDVTELRGLQQDLAALALRDPLTGLANRRLFKELLDASLARSQRSNAPLAIAFLDLDGFKNVNDNFGHDAGDLVLCETAKRLISVVRGADVVARLGGDEFVIVFEPNDPNSDHIGERIEAALSVPIRINDTVAVRCPASIGLADSRTTGRDAAALLTAADTAMYEMKRAHRRLAGTRQLTVV